MISSNRYRRASAFVGGCVLYFSCAVVAGQPAAGISWSCVATGSGETALLPSGYLAGVVNRYAGLYTTRVLGLVQSGDRVYLLGTGGFASRASLRAEVPSAGPGRNEFVSQPQDFQLAPGNPRSGAAGFICLRNPDAGRHGLARDGQGRVMLAARATVFLLDPSDPSVTVELRAAAHEAMRLHEIAALGGRMGVYAGLMRQRGQRDARIAVQGADGRIAFRAAPETAPAAASTGSVTLAVSGADNPPPAAVEKSQAIASRAQAPAVAPAVRREPVVAASVPAPVPVQAAGLPAEPVAVELAKTAARDASYENALRKLLERQGGGSVRSVSALTRVHPAVDALSAWSR